VRLAVRTFTLAVAATAPLVAQAPASQRGTVSQMIGATEVEVVYSRPVARGRALFGALVPYGEVWTPGANKATTVEVSRDVTIEGESLAGGKYSLWTIPGETEWTIILSRQWDAWHVRYPEGQDALRVVVKPTSGMHMETLAIYFPVVGPDSATMHVHWGTTMVPIRIGAPPGA